MINYCNNFISHLCDLSSMKEIFVLSFPSSASSILSLSPCVTPLSYYYYRCFSHFLKKKRPIFTITF